MGVNLSDLRIHDDDRSGRMKKVKLSFRSVLGFVIAFCLGVAVTYVFLGGDAEDAKSTTHARSDVPNPAASIDGFSRPYFTAGGWIEVPFPFPVMVSSLIEGRLDELLVWEGREVEKGSVVARLYRTDFENALKLAEARVVGAEARLAKFKAGNRAQEIEKARAEVHEARAQLEVARRISLRSQELLKSGAISEERAELDEAAFRVAEARLAQAQQLLALLEAGSREEDIVLAEAELQQAQAELQIAKMNLEYTVICAPISGVVLHRFVNVGERVSPEKPLLSIYDPSQLQMRVDVTQSDIGQVFVGQQVEIITEASPERKFRGEVLRIEPLADLAKNTITVRIKILQPDRMLFPEMTARARFMKNRQQ